jgi:methionyl-tRNA formyltransferase
MIINKPRIVFMGTPEFAAESLKVLLSDGWPVVGVVTVADKPKGRGQVLTPSLVKEVALSHKLPVLQPTNLKDPEFLEQLELLAPDLGVVVAFRMLPEVVWKMPTLGTVNLHASLLPQYRGAAPIHHAVINGEKVSGMTIFFLQHEIDTGQVIIREELPIGENETTGELHDRMMKAGAGLLSQAIGLIAEGAVSATDQNSLIAKGERLKTAPKIFPEHCRIVWNQPAAKIHNLIRGMSPFPCASTSHRGQNIKIYRGKLTGSDTSESPGTLKAVEGRRLLVATGDRWYEILSLKPEGKKQMTAEEFLRGYSHTLNEPFSDTQ